MFDKHFDGPELAISKADGGTVVTLHRSSRANAITLDTASELRAAFARARHSKFLLLEGVSPFFCCGLDRSEVPRLFRSRQSAVRGVWRFQSVIRDLRRVPIPVVTYADGAVVGGGCGIFWAGDIALAGPAFRMRLQFAKLGLALDMGTSAFGPRRADPVTFQRLYLRDPLLSLEEAAALGLVDNPSPAPCTREDAIEQAASLARGSSQPARRPRSFALDVTLLRETIRQARLGLAVTPDELTKQS